MALPDGTLPFSGGAMMGGDGSPVSRDDIFKLRMTRGGFTTEAYDPLQSPDTEVDINETELFSITSPGIYAEIVQSLASGRIPTITAGTDGRVRRYYYTASDVQAGTMAFANAHDRFVEILTLHSDGTYEIAYGGSSVPLVRVKFQNGAWSKISGDDGFIKPNRWGVDSLFLPESCWWSIGVGISVVNNTPRDLIQHLQMKYEWNSYISMDVPPLTYEEGNLPSMTYEADFTRANTNNRYTTSLYKKDGATEDWLSVALTAYHDTLPNDLEWALWMNIFKVRDA